MRATPKMFQSSICGPACVVSVLGFSNVVEKLITQMSEPETWRCQHAAGCPPLSLCPLHTGLIGAEGECCSVSALWAIPASEPASTHIIKHTLASRPLNSSYSGGIITLSKYDDTVLKGRFAGVSFIRMLKA